MPMPKLLICKLDGKLRTASGKRCQTVQLLCINHHFGSDPGSIPDFVESQIFFSPLPSCVLCVGVCLVCVFGVRVWCVIGV